MELWDPRLHTRSFRTHQQALKKQRDAEAYVNPELAAEAKERGNVLFKYVAVHGRSMHADAYQGRKLPRCD